MKRILSGIIIQFLLLGALVAPQQGICAMFSAVNMAHGGSSKTYATWNPADKGATITLSNGNLDANMLSAPLQSLRATVGKISGKWYFEARSTTGSAGDVGVANATQPLTSCTGSTTSSVGYFGATGRILYNGVQTVWGATYATQTQGVALDLDNGALYFSLNGVWQHSGDPTSGASKTGAWTTLPTGRLFPSAGNAGNNPVTTRANFGATPFAYPVPTGYAGWSN